MAIEKLIEKFLNLKVNRENTRIAYRKNLSDFAEYLAAKEVTLQECKSWDIDEYKNELKKNYAPSSINQRMACLRSFYKFLEKNDIANNIVDVENEIVENTHDVYLNDNEIKYLLTYLTKRERKSGERNFEFLKVRDLLFMLLDIKVGLRYCEIVTLTRDSFNLNKMVINISGDIRKNKRALTLPIDDEIKKLYQDYMDLRDEVEKKRECEPFIFISANGKKLSNNNVNTMIKKHILAANNYYESIGSRNRIREDVSCHKLRHTCGYLLTKKNYTIAEVANVLGHVSQGSTQRYIHTNIDDMRKKQFNLIGE